MAVSLVLENVVRTAACNAEVDLIDAGGGAGYVTICESDDDVLVTLPLPATAFGAATNGVATAAAIDPVAAAAGGVAAKYKAYDHANTLLWTGNVGTSATSMIVPSTTVVQSVPFSITSWTHTVPAGT
jgi:hypothetical protein